VSIYLGRVNQKLFNARQLLADIDAASDPRRRQMLLESLLLQLRLACHFHLRHIAAQYQCREPEAIESIADLLAQLDALDKSPGEASEIQALTTDPHSWLSRLDDCWRQCFHSGERAAVKEVDGLIPLAVIDATEDFTPELGGQWLAALTELVTRQREVMVEC